MHQSRNNLRVRTTSERNWKSMAQLHSNHLHNRKQTGGSSVIVQTSFSPYLAMVKNPKI